MSARYTIVLSEIRLLCKQTFRESNPQQIWQAYTLLKETGVTVAF